MIAFVYGYPPASVDDDDDDDGYDKEDDRLKINNK